MTLTEQIIWQLKNPKSCKNCKQEYTEDENPHYYFFWLEGQLGKFCNGYTCERITPEHHESP
jgi:hypothetical protein